MLIRFGKFELDSRRYQLTCEGRAIKLEPIPMKLLFYLAESKGALVSRQAITEHLWGKDVFVDAQHSVNTAINKLRTALNDDLADPRFIQTVKGLGYRFIAEVLISRDADSVIETPPVLSTSSNGNHLEAGEARSLPSESAASVMTAHFESGEAAERSAGLEGFLTARDLEAPFALAPATVTTQTPSVRVSRFPKVAIPLLLVASIAASIAAVGVFYRLHRRTPLTDRDTIVLADFANSTGDAVFDDTLKTALSVSLRQSPFLNVLPDSQYTETLRLMERSPDAKLTPELTRELCQRADGKAYVDGSIVSLGSQYVISLKAVNCRSGDLLAEEQATAASKESVLGALGRAASKLRGELGESLANVQKFDVPLERTTTSSLEALKAFSQGALAAQQQGVTAAQPWHERAIELDPNFAMAYKALGDDYSVLGEVEPAREYLTRAFQLRENTSGREKLQITAAYYEDVTGELDKAALTLQEEIQNYRRGWQPYGALAAVFVQLGQYEKAAEITRQALREAPETGGYGDLANCMLALQRLDEARKTIRDAQAVHSPDVYPLHEALYALAFLGGDTAGMAEEQKWFASTPHVENFGIALASDTEAYAGRLGHARELTMQARDSALRTGVKEDGATWEAIGAQREAVYGNVAEARRMAAQALQISPTNQGVESETALAFALAGDTAKAQSLARDLGKRFPLDTQTQSLWLPTIQAQMALDNRNPEAAITALQSSSPIESGQILYVLNISCLYPTYVRGEAYLAAGRSTAAAAEFQKILDHSGMVWNCWTGAMAHLGVARAYALQSRTAQDRDAEAARTRALTAYMDFFKLWKDADSDIPILKAAKAEYAHLH